MRAKLAIMVFGVGVLPALAVAPAWAHHAFAGAIAKCPLLKFNDPWASF